MCGLCPNYVSSHVYVTAEKGRNSLIIIVRLSLNFYPILPGQRLCTAQGPCTIASQVNTGPRVLGFLGGLDAESSTLRWLI